MAKAKNPLNGGLRNRLFLWRVAQAFAEFVLQLSTNVCDNVFPDCRAGVAVYFLAASFRSLSGLRSFLALRCVADIKAKSQVQGDGDNDSDDDLAVQAHSLFWC
ncbi:hypothetical protein [Pseudomonas laurylsulfativorans]|uniref:hypothetical protein n=1 Tax=Pseudomonas laurylsulfativorans TaxID=1943631 RepID=UPI0013FDB973|nr:hypothetical protein [Pseudomonas laurylsulfativorans]